MRSGHVEGRVSDKVLSIYIRPVSYKKVGVLCMTIFGRLEGEKETT
jgi:hypothetical protein